MQRFILIFFLVTNIKAMAQKDSTKPIEFSGYVDVYYAYDFTKPQNHEMASFLYNYKRSNEVNINLALIKAAYSDQKVRANFALMVGNYAQYNMASEPTWAQFVNEANVGFRLSNKNNLWLDAGVLPSHIGFESAVGADCPTLTRSILAENTPYFETGAKLTYTNKSEKIFLSFLYLNGWQQISKPDFMNKPSFGLQFNYKINKSLNFNYSNFIGTAYPDSLNLLRYYHNLYLQFLNESKINFTLGFDVGSQTNGTKFIWVYSPLAIVQYKINKKVKLASRIEYYQDKKQLIIPALSPNGFNVIGASINIDKKITNKLLWRLECKQYWSEDKIWGTANKQNMIITTALSMKF
jgi:hypothetical protein